MDETLSYTPFWQHLKNLLAQRQITMTELGASSGVKTQAIYKWRKAQPSVASIRKIAQALGEDPRRLLILAGHLDESEVGTAPASTPTLRDIELAIMCTNVLTAGQKGALIETARAFSAVNQAPKPTNVDDTPP